jgi:hypothetical protein
MWNHKNWSSGKLKFGIKAWVRRGMLRWWMTYEDKGWVPGVWNYIIAGIYTGHASRRCVVHFRVQSTFYPTQTTLRFFHSISLAPPLLPPLIKHFPWN